MNLTNTQKSLLGVNIAIVLGFSWYYLQALNYEFFAYAITIALVVSVLFGTYRNKTKHGVLTVYFSNTKLRDIIMDAIEELRRSCKPT
jgi:hypothetical protein